MIPCGMSPRWRRNDRDDFDIRAARKALVVVVILILLLIVALIYALSSVPLTPSACKAFPTLSALIIAPNVSKSNPLNA